MGKLRLAVMVWLPDHIWRKQKKGKGKGKGSQGMVMVPASMMKAVLGGGGKKGSAKSAKPKNVLKKAPAEKSIFISGLPEGTDKGPKLDKLNKELQKHLSQMGIKCEAAEVWKNGNGSALFATKKDVAKAMESLNGSAFKDSVLTIDAWEKKEK